MCGSAQYANIRKGPTGWQHAFNMWIGPAGEVLALCTIYGSVQLVIPIDPVFWPVHTQSACGSAQSKVSGRAQQVVLGQALANPVHNSADVLSKHVLHLSLARAWELLGQNMINYRTSDQYEAKRTRRINFGYKCCTGLTSNNRMRKGTYNSIIVQICLGVGSDLSELVGAGNCQRSGFICVVSASWKPVSFTSGTSLLVVTGSDAWSGSSDGEGNLALATAAASSVSLSSTFLFLLSLTCKTAFSGFLVKAISYRWWNLAGGPAGKRLRTGRSLRARHRKDGFSSATGFERRSDCMQDGIDGRAEGVNGGTMGVVVVGTVVEIAVDVAIAGTCAEGWR
ncbi:uncharacterized protein F5147DRAFT_656175 [Suillus discolor]|uniref:Uncharacterized protein n=1 Tax=Suillus discolor TaxID=1912936 RepID=A0A9P7F077_9AGAM|nr:uncharacterized protein F5147DRAFT_656175 [Suillus discolor]KAG2097924.1 hypothetical protein F5147DRAFT_656175 [Suillus discolor]